MEVLIGWNNKMEDYINKILDLKGAKIKASNYANHLQMTYYIFVYNGKTNLQGHHLISNIRNAFDDWDEIDFVGEVKPTIKRV